MTSSSSLSTWIQRLQAGDGAAAQPLWEHYHTRLVELARQRLAGALRSSAEDVAALALAECSQAIQAGRHPNLTNRDDLWRLLLAITLNQARRLGRDESRQCRDFRRNASADDLFDLPGADLDRLAGPEPDPAVVAEVNDTLRHLLERLPADLRGVAVELLAGRSPAEVAGRIRCSVRTVERRRERIRTYWLVGDLE